MNSSTSSSHRQGAPIATGLRPVLIVADDLTGACDSAAAFVEKADTVRVLLQPGDVQAEPGAVTAVSTETRNLSSPEAVRIVERTVRESHHFRDAGILFKKVDSAGRGHLVEETMAALQASGAALVLIAPAFPEAGRTVSGGVLHIRDAAQQDSYLDLAAMFAAHGQHVDLLPMANEDELERALRRAIDHGTGVLVCDAETQRDLDRLMAAACRMRQPILWTGSAGLALALASRLSPAHSERPVDREWPAGRTLLFVGTDHPVANLQISHLQQESAIANAQIHRLEWNNSSAECVREAFSEAPVSALILTGGDTAAFVLGTLNAHAIRLAGELGPGVPWGYIEGGDADGCVVVTKSGGFGRQDTLTNAFHFCSRRAYAPA